MSMRVHATGGAELCSPVFDPSGKLFVASAGSGGLLTEGEEKGNELTEWANTEGQPNGAAFNPKGSMYVCDLAHNAVMNWHENGSQQIVVREYEGKSFKGPNSVVFDSSGTMYFTDSGPMGETTLQNPGGSVYCVSGPAGAQILRPIALNCLAHPCGLALSADQNVVFVCEMMRNRILRFVQRPVGVYHMSVFYQFSGRMGPSAIACDYKNDGMLYVARYDLRDCSDDGVVSVISSEGKLVKELKVPGAEVSGLTIGPDSDALFITEASTNTVFSVPLPLKD